MVDEEVGPSEPEELVIPSEAGHNLFQIYKQIDEPPIRVRRLVDQS